MQKAKIVEILKAFTKAEMLDLTVFINRNKAIENTHTHKLFILLNKNYPFFTDKNINKEKVFKKLFGGKKFDDNKLSKIMSELTKLIEEFIVMLQLKTNRFQHKLELLKFYNERNLEKYYLQIEKEIEKLQIEIPMGVHSQMMIYQFEEIKLNYGLKHQDRSTNYQNIYNILVSFSEAEKLRWKNLSHINMFPTILESKNSSVLFIIHSKLESLLVNNEEKKINEILYYFDQNYNIEKEQSRDILFTLLYYCLQKVNSGDSNYYRHVIDLFHTIESYGLILNTYNKIDLSTYKNYITCALKINKINDAESFLEKYKQSLPENVAIEVYHFNKALIEFEKKAYSNVLDLIIYCKFTDVFYKLNQRRLIIKTYYELMEHDNTYHTVLIDAIIAFKKYLSIVKNLPELFIELNKNFLHFLSEILDSHRSKRITKSILLNKLNSTKHITERIWIEEKINKLN